MYAKLERLLSKSLTTLEVMAYYLVVHTGPEQCWNLSRFRNQSGNPVKREGWGKACLFVGRLLNVLANMPVYFRDGSAQTILRAATLR